jgi:hypothetical protein
MEVKGTAVKSIPDFVKTKFPHRYQEWLNALPPDSGKLMGGTIFANNWYQADTAVLQPTQAIIDLFYGGNPKGAWDCGRFSAETGLTGLYKFFVKAASPGFIISKAGSIMATYYRPSELKVVNEGKNFVVVHMSKVDKTHPIIEARIAGWIEKALEISGCKSIQVSIPNSITRGAGHTEFSMKWN